MLYAVNETGKRIGATPGATGTCPLCKQPVRPKTGRIVTWHWAHVNLEDCDTWSEPETAWHLGWKRMLNRAAPTGPACEVEKVIERNGVRHRADVYNPNKIVLELQHSSISPLAIEARQRFYTRLWWLFDAREAYAENRLLVWDKGDYHTFQWKHPRASLIFVNPRLFLQLSSTHVLEVRKKTLEKRLFGWGRLMTTTDFSRLVRNAA